MTNNDIKILGAKLKVLRQKRGFTQAQLAELVDCSNTYVSLLEKGDKCMSLDMFIFVANALNVSADELLQDFLENTIAVSNHEFASLVADCTTYEKRILIDLIVSAKKTLRENRRLFRP